MSTDIEQTRIEPELLAFLHERTGEAWPTDRDLFADGGLSSMFAMELVVYLESTFGVTISGPDLQLANFRSVTAMAGLVSRLRSSGG
jgi:methoxymalonate biosynthesis acyl carrier protein